MHMVNRYEMPFAVCVGLVYCKLLNDTKELICIPSRCFHLISKMARSAKFFSFEFPHHFTTTFEESRVACT